MAEYWVEGAEKHSGTDVTIIVSAMNEEAARAEASRRGVLVSKVTRREIAGAASVAGYRGRDKPAVLVSATGLLMSGVVAAGIVASVGYLWILYVVARVLSGLSGSTSGGIRSALPNRGLGGTGVFDVTDALAVLLIPVAVPVVVSVFFHCLAAGLYGLRARLLLIDAK